MWIFSTRSTAKYEFWHFLSKTVAHIISEIKLINAIIKNMETALKIHVTGVVQGVGFRPFVYRQAQHYLIKGWVLNSADGVHIHAEGDENLVDEFCLSLSNDAPAASKVEQIEMKEIPLEGFKDFSIKHSKDEKTSKAGDEAGQTLISPDLATCDDCVKELFDKSDRRYRYPFINCTNCGPRFTIIGRLPYDRPYTSMSKFKMCDACQNEYSDPLDRRFHAQPDACFDCGPFVYWSENKNYQQSEDLIKKDKSNSSFELIEKGKSQKKSDEIFSKCVQFLKSGKIVAIKGLGGFHLACDATNNDAVQTLRKRKMRSNKAFAIMAKDIEAAKLICEINTTEGNLLQGSSRPIVLLKDKHAGVLAPDVTNGLAELGVMLPYTPVQHILMHDFVKAGGKYLVMTSGNVYDNPIVTDDEEATKVFGDIADAILGNNREILARYDDSVMRVIDAAGTEAVQVIRRARGQAPMPIKINRANVDESFATGPEQKNSFAYSRVIPNAESDKFNSEVFVSQHIGDMDNAATDEAWNFAKDQYAKIFKFKSKKIYCDLHPEYLTSKWAEKQNLPVKKVQHHYAHIRAVMYENNLRGPVLGFAFDGTGYGVDGTIWGGEAMLCNLENFERFANFAYVPMPGGAVAIKNPMRMAYSVLWSFDLLEHESAKKVLKHFDSEEIEVIKKSIEQEINTPYTSSVGRLFDAASALLGICQKPSYEGEAAIMLEAELWRSIHENKDLLSADFDNRYEIKLTKNVAGKNSTAQDTSVILFDASGTFKSILIDMKNEIEFGYILKNFHDAFVRAILGCSQLAKQVYGINDIALSGGVFMNRYLIENTIAILVDNGFSVALNRDVPPNDGGLSLGQL